MNVSELIGLLREYPADLSPRQNSIAKELSEHRDT